MNLDDASVVGGGPAPGAGLYSVQQEPLDRGGQVHKGGADSCLLRDIGIEIEPTDGGATGFKPFYLWQQVCGESL